MPRAKVAITMDEDLLKRLDRLVEEGRFPNRSKAVEEAVQERLEQIERTRLAREASKLDPAYEQALAEEGLSGDLTEWPEY
ncbi:MAG: ribbon-helix-helix protein, CopG family [Anaerolineales bacterium]|nr:ribbon-helix-helix protein, CopG family [Anaerolineales bacterium]